MLIQEVVIIIVIIIFIINIDDHKSCWHCHAHESIHSSFMLAFFLRKKSLAFISRERSIVVCFLFEEFFRRKKELTQKLLIIIVGTIVIIAS
mgnify:CR=1 FL=1